MKQPKKLLLALLCLILVIAVTVGCTFTGAESKSAPTETTEPTEPTKTTEPIKTITPIGTIVPEEELISTYYENGNYRIPQFDEEYGYYKKLNESILERFGSVTQGDTSEFTSIDYSYCQHGNILSLLIIGENGTKTPVYESYNIDMANHTAVDILDDELYENIRNILPERFIRELIERYMETGNFSFDSATQEICAKNLGWNSYCEWLDQDGKVWVSFAYHPLDGSEAKRWDVCPAEYTRIVPEWEVTPQVVELFSYEGYSGTCHIPFLMMSGRDALSINAEILQMYTKGLSRCEFSWAINADILSLKIDAERDYNEHSVYNLSVSQGTRLTAKDVYAAAGLSTEEYMAAAKEAIQKYHFVRYGGTDSPISTQTHHFLAAADGGASNIALAMPYLDSNGELELLARMFQIAGSSSQLQFVPMKGVESTQEYLDFLSVPRTELDLVPTFNQLGYVIESYPDGPAGAQYFDALNTDFVGTSYPIYANPYPSGHGGPAYEFTDALLAEKEHNLQSYLTLLLGEGSYDFYYESSSYNDESVTFKTPAYSNGELTIYGNAQGVTVASPGSLILEGVSVEQIYSEPIIEAALRYTGITSPVFEQKTVYETTLAFNGSVDQYCYTITDASADASTELCKMIYITRRAKTGKIYICLTRAEAPTQVGTTQSATTLDIVELLADRYPQYRRDSFRVEFYYDPTVVIGYYVPCYRVYIKDNELSEQYGMPTYAVFELCESRFPTNLQEVLPWQY